MRRRPFQDEEGTSEENSEDDSASDSDSSDDDDGPLALNPEEEAMLEKAMAKIRKAQAKGKKDVKLNSEEYALLMRRKELQDAEARRRNQIRAPIEDVLPQHPSPRSSREGLHRDGPHAREIEAAPPPMGYFPPPARPRSGTTSTTSRPRSGTASTTSRPPSRSTNIANTDRRSSPLAYSYVSSQQAHRHVSDTGPGHPPPRGPVPQDQSWIGDPYGGLAPVASNSAPSLAHRQSQLGLDPFQYMTTGAQTPYHRGDVRASTPPERRPLSGPVGEARAYMASVAGVRPPSARSSSRLRGSRRVSSDESLGAPAARQDEASEVSESTSDEPDQGARVASTGSHRGRPGEDVVVVEDSPEPEPEPRRTRGQASQAAARKKAGQSASPVKRKPVVGGTGGSRRRKK